MKDDRTYIERSVVCLHFCEENEYPSEETVMQLLRMVTERTSYRSSERMYSCRINPKHDIVTNKDTILCILLVYFLIALKCTVNTRNLWARRCYIQ